MGYKSVNWMAFAKDLQKLCKKHGVSIGAYYLGSVWLSSVYADNIVEAAFTDFQASPEKVILENGDHSIIIE